MGYSVGNPLESFVNTVSLLATGAILLLIYSEEGKKMFVVEQAPVTLKTGSWVHRPRCSFLDEQMKKIVGWIILGVLVILGWVLLFSYLNSPQFY